MEILKFLEVLPSPIEAKGSSEYFESGNCRQKLKLYRIIWFGHFAYDKENTVKIIVRSDFGFSMFDLWFTWGGGLFPIVAMFLDVLLFWLLWPLLELC